MAEAAGPDPRGLTDDGVAAAVAAHGVTLLDACNGGEFGARHAVGADGSQWVLKASPMPEIRDRLPVAAATTGRLRDLGYPAPHYGPSGHVDDVTWYLQERLPGTVPETAKPTHIETLAALAQRHADLADRPGPWPRTFSDEIDWAIAQLRHYGGVANVEELAAAADRVRGVQLRTSDIAHGDFHLLNFLAEGDEVTGIFDWDFVIVGDWRVDLVVLAFWTQAFQHIGKPTEPIASSAAAAERAMLAVCGDGELAKMALWITCREVAFSTLTHTRERVDWTMQRVADVRHWWQ